MSNDMGRDSRNNSGVPQELQSTAGRFVPRPVDVQEVPVLINLSQAFDDFVAEYFQFAETTLAAHGGSWNLDLDTFRKYVRTLIHSRVKWVRRERYTVHPTDNVVVPTLISHALAAMGRVDLDEVGIVFVPDYNPVKEEVLTADQALQVSAALKPLSFMGFSFARGYERDRRGAFDLMALQYLENHEKGPGVYGHDRKAAQAFAPVSYLLGLRQLQTLLGTRVVYGDSVSLTTALRQLAVV